MLRASDSFFLCHLFQVVVVLGVLTGSEGENGDSKSGDWMTRVAERECREASKLPVCSFNPPTIKPTRGALRARRALT